MLVPCIIFGVASPLRADDSLLGPLAVPVREDPGCEALRTEAEDDPEPTLVIRQGVRGLWMAMDTAKLVLCESRELRIKRRELTLVDQELRLFAKQVQIYAEQADLMKEGRDYFGDVLLVSESRASEAEAKLDAWWRHPAFWTAVGVAAGLAGGIPLGKRLAK